jgi:hypothetical protein
MSAVRTLLIGILGTLCILAGCAKKPKQPSPAVSVSSTTGQTARTDSGDIFNEFYNDSAVDKAKTLKTFSLHPSTPPAPGTASPANASGSYTPAFSDNGRYVVQVATMVSRWLADELATELKEKGYPSYVIEVQNPTQNLTGTYYRVRIGGFATRTDAQAFGENILVPARLSYWVDRKSNESSAPLESQLNQNFQSYGTSTYTPPSSPSYAPPPSSYESTIVPGPGATQGTYGQTPAPSSTGGWSDSSSKW